jgi:hypothetical protein
MLSMISSNTIVIVMVNNIDLVASRSALLGFFVVAVVIRSFPLVQAVCDNKLKCLYVFWLMVRFSSGRIM